MKQNKLWILPILFLLALGFASAACTYEVVADGADYFNVSTEVYSTSTLTSDQLYNSVTAFTPRLNFTRPVTETFFSGGVVGGCVGSGWSSYTNISSSLVIKNGTVPIDPSNYTFTWINQTTGTWCANFTEDWSSTLSLNVFFNRTFVKNVDDLTLPALIKSGSTYSDWVIQNTPTAYGEQKIFKFNGASYGAFVNVSNWAVTGTYIQRTCTAIDISASDGIGKTKTLAYAAFALLAVMIIVTVAWGLMQLFRGGDVDFMSIAIAAIGFGIIIMLAYMIIYYVALGLGA